MSKLISVWIGHNAASRELREGHLPVGLSIISKLHDRGGVVGVQRLNLRLGNSLVAVLAVDSPYVGVCLVLADSFGLLTVFLLHYLYLSFDLAVGFLKIVVDLLSVFVDANLPTTGFDGGLFTYFSDAICLVLAAHV